MCCCSFSHMTTHTHTYTILTHRYVHTPPCTLPLIYPIYTPFNLSYLHNLVFTQHFSIIHPFYHTGIVTGGLVCWVPFMIHLFALKDVDLTLWVMVLPGVYYGAKLAPFCHEKFGLTNIMWAFAAFLFATAGLFSYM